MKDILLLNVGECLYKQEKYMDSFKELKQFDKINEPKEFYMSYFKKGKCMDK